MILWRRRILGGEVRLKRQLVVLYDQSRIHEWLTRLGRFEGISWNPNPASVIPWNRGIPRCLTKHSLSIGKGHPAVWLPYAHRIRISTPLYIIVSTQNPGSDFNLNFTS
jgi:hypothetical protein